jgi:outer membrane protein assembly factor BamB
VLRWDASWDLVVGYMRDKVLLEGGLPGMARRTKRSRGSRVGHLLFVATVAALVGSATPAFASLPDTSSPELRLARTIRTSPFAGSSISMKDAEGSAFVPSDNSLWLADDNGRAVFEINPITGTLKQKIDQAAFESAPKFGGGSSAGTNRVRDIESMAYDQANDTLYVFSGPCCSGSVLPTAFRLTRNAGVFRVESYQPLGSGANYTAAGWNSADGKIYVGKGAALRTYAYATNTAGPIFKVPNLSGILGMAFSSDGADLFVTTSAEKLRRVNWASKTLVSGWTFDLIPFKVKDSRAVELINDQFYVVDGYDGRSSGDPLRHAVFVFDVLP